MKVLICSDGSSQAEHAIRFGGRIASDWAAEVTLLGITEKREEQDSIFDSLKRGADLLQDLEVSSEIVIKAGDPIEEIVQRTRDTDFHLVVIGAIRKGTRGKFVMSAKAYRIIKAVDPPVLVVIGNRERLKRILICSGGEKYIDRAVEYAGAMAKPAGALITLFHVMPEPPSSYSDLIRMEEDVNLLIHSGLPLGENLGREKEVLERIGVQSEVKLRHGLVISEVLKEIRRGDYDLVVTGSSPAGGTLRTYIMGNITREIVNRADCPVLVVRGGDEPVGFSRTFKGFISDLTSAFASSKDKRD